MGSTDAPLIDHPTTPTEESRADQWRGVARRAFAWMDSALEVGNVERNEMLAEGCAEIEAKIERLDAAERAA